MKPKHFILSLLALFASINAFAYDAYIDGIYYNFHGDEAEVTNSSSSLTGSCSILPINGVIPSFVIWDGKTYSVTSIGEYAFQNYRKNGSTAITIPESVVYIGSCAFYNCTYLTSITIPESVTYIGSNAFLNTRWFSNQPDGLVYAGKVAYKYKGTMPSGTHIDILEGTLGISGAAFHGCTGLTSITIPNSVTVIGHNAFNNCGNLSSITFPNGATRITPSAIFGTAWYDNQPEGMVYAGKVALIYKGTMPEGTHITLKEGTLAIAEYAFQYGNLSSITIPNSVTYIGEAAFYGCGITSVIIPNGITSIEPETFWGCVGLTSVSIPNSVTSIGDEAFYSCRALTSIAIPCSVTSIGQKAFLDCTSLTAVHITDLAAWCGISFGNGSHLMYNAKHLYLNGQEIKGHLDIPNGVTSIGRLAFDSCIGITSVTIPSSVTSIGESAFYGCSGLTDFYSYAEEVPYTDGNPFYNSPISSATLHVPAGSIDAYSTTEPWSNFGSIVAIGNVSESKYRYYKLVITGLQGSGDCIQFSEFDLLDESLSEVATMNVYAGTGGFDNESWPNVTDNDVHTKYCGSFSGNTYFLFDAISEIEPYGYRFYTASDTPRFPERNPSSWVLYGSNTKLTDPNDHGWELIDERNNDKTLQATSYVPYDFYVRDVTNKLSFSKQSITLLPNDELQLQVRDRFNTIGDLTLQWTSSNTSVATVNNQGLVVAKGLGSANITVTAVEDNTLKATCTVSVVADLPGHRYYQFAVEATAGNTQIQLSEFDLLDQNGIEITPLSTYAYTGSAYSDNETQEKLFDDDINTKYCGPFSSGLSLYIYIDAGKKVSLSGYRMTTSYDTRDYPERNPVTWSLLGSNTKSNQPNDAAWTLLDYRENDNTIGAQSWTPYDFFFTYPDESSIISFADNNVKTICVANWDTNGDGELSEKEAAAVTDLGTVFWGNKEIISFDELQSFTGLTSIGDYVFSDCSSLTSVTIPNGVTSIGDRSFRDCSALTSVIIPNSMTSIGDYAFVGCSSLTSITIPNSVISIGDGAFWSCSSLTSITIPNSVAIICDYTFWECSSLTSITIPNSVISIGDGAFWSCSSLTSITIPNGVTSIGNRVFEDCVCLTSITIPNSVISIGDYAFGLCSGLTSITIPNSVTSIGGYAFSGCSDLTSVTIPNSVTSIGDCAFRDCFSLTSITIPNSVRSINDSTFSGCASLTSINIPESVTSIGNYAFSLCSSLTDVWCYTENVPTTSSNAFKNSPTGSATLHVPARSLQAYKTTTPWSDFGTIMAIAIILNDDMATLNFTSEESGKTIEFTHVFNGEWEALCLPFAIDYDAIKADFDLAEIDGVVQNDDNYDGIPDITVLCVIGFKGQMTTPNKPYLIRAKNAGEQTIVFDDVTVFPTTIESIDCSSTSIRYEFTGSYNTLNASALANRYIVQNGELVKGASSLAPCRWYMTATARNGAPLNLPNKMRIMLVEDFITEVSPLLTSPEEEENVYNLAGQRLSKPQKGINIKGGKKIISK